MLHLHLLDVILEVGQELDTFLRGLESFLLDDLLGRWLRIYCRLCPLLLKIRDQLLNKQIVQLLLTHLYNYNLKRGTI